MNRHRPGAAFIQRISTEALQSDAVNHPYLVALRDGDLPDTALAFQDFAFQYGLYCSGFIRYLTAVIDNLHDAGHKRTLLSNLAEEQGHAHDVDLPPDVLSSIQNQPHTALFRRFQDALGVDDEYRESERSRGLPGQSWSQQFQQLCSLNACVGVGAIGIGTEHIVSKIYQQILQGLQAHSDLSMTQRVFFDLHSQCDDEHGAQLLRIAQDLASDPVSCEQLEYGATTAINLRVEFWDQMLERALNCRATTSPELGKLSAIGY